MKLTLYILSFLMILTAIPALTTPSTVVSSAEPALSFTKSGKVLPG